VEVVMGEVTQEELIALLLKVEGNRPDSLGICSQWYRNPEGPQAADTITALQAELAEARAEVERLMRYVEDVAKQWLPGEPEPFDDFDPSFEDGYTIIVDRARQALAGKETP
jgi:hypothetical protein